MMAAIRHLMRVVCTVVAFLVGGERVPGSEPPQPTQSARGAEEPIRLVTKTGELHGSLDLPAGAGPFPVVVILAGSGPTDRDGNQPGLKNDSLKMVGRGLAERGIAALRYDRRGIGKSREACLKEEDLRFDLLADDAAAWVKLLRTDRRFGKVGIVGHSEGSLSGMLAAKRANADAFVSLAGTGRDAPSGLRSQIARNLPPAYKELKEKSDQIIAELAAGRTVAEIPKLLESLFRPSVQPYLISVLAFTTLMRDLVRMVVPDTDRAGNNRHAGPAGRREAPRHREEGRAMARDQRDESRAEARRDPRRTSGHLFRPQGAACSWTCGGSRGVLEQGSQGENRCSRAVAHA